MDSATIGIIAGCVVGGVVVITLIVIVVVWYVLKSKREHELYSSSGHTKSNRVADPSAAEIAAYDVDARYANGSQPYSTSSVGASSLAEAEDTLNTENGIVNKAYQLVADDSIAVPRGHTTATVNQGVDVVDTSNEQDVSHNLLRSKESAGGSQANSQLDLYRMSAASSVFDDGATNATFEREHLAMGAAAAASGSTPVYSEPSSGVRLSRRNRMTRATAEAIAVQKDYLSSVYLFPPRAGSSAVIGDDVTIVYEERTAL